MIDRDNLLECCGCGGCVQICPKQCLTLAENEEGFLYPTIAEGGLERCIDCGLCEKICPKNHPLEKIPFKRFCIAKSASEEERLCSSSGGLFIELAKVILERGGVVFGAVFDEHWGVQMTYAETLGSARRMMGSKYVQADVGTTYKDAKTFLTNGRLVLFTGTACQIAGLHHFLGRCYDNLITTDVLCHGAPSPGVWRRYLHDLISPATLSSIQNLSFRDKRYGWRGYRLTLDLQGESGAVKAISDTSYVSGFGAELYLRPSCHQCKYKNGACHSDITIGDCWGVEKVMPQLDDNKGISLVALSTDKGEELLSQLPIERYDITNTKRLLRNGGFRERTVPNKRRAEFFMRYSRGEESIPSILKDMIKQPPKYKKMTRPVRLFLEGLINKILSKTR